MLETDPEILFVDAPTQAARNFADAVAIGSWNEAWVVLSPRLQQTITARLGAEYDNEGAAGLRDLAEAVSERPEDRLAALFGFAPNRVLSFEPGETPSIPPSSARDGRATVFAVGENGQASPLKLFFDGSHWRLDSLPVEQG